MKNIIFSDIEYSKLAKMKEEEYPECFTIKEYILKKIIGK